MKLQNINNKKKNIYETSKQKEKEKHLQIEVKHLEWTMDML